MKKIYKIGKTIYGAYSNGGQGLDMNAIGSLAKDGLDIINNDLGGIDLNKITKGFGKFFK